MPILNEICPSTACILQEICYIIFYLKGVLDMRRGFIAIISCILVLALAPVSFAGTTGSGEATAWTKLLGGLSNTLLGWTELPRRIYDTSQDKGIGEGLTTGLIDGLAYGIARTGAGIIDTALFYMPPFDKPIMDPLYNF